MKNIFIIIVVALLSFNANSQTLKISKTFGHIAKDKAVVSGHAPRSSVSIDFTRTEIVESNGKKHRKMVHGSETEGLWLTTVVTIKYIDGRKKEIDFGAQMVRGSFKVKFEIPGGYTYNMSSINWTARLWSGRVFPEVCKHQSSGMCKYCREIGYHMWNPMGMEKL